MMEDATPVTVGVGETVTGIDALMEYGSSVSGTVTNAAGAAVPGVEVRLEWFEGGEWRSEWAYTDETGSYIVWVRHPGTYTVHFVPPGAYAEEWWDDKPSQETAEAIVLGYEEQRTGVDAVVSRGTVISGMVNDSGGTPMWDVLVRVSWQDGGTWRSRTTRTDIDGTYWLAAPSGVPCRVSFEPEAPYLHEWWDGKPTRADADPITLAEGEERAGVDAVLTTGGSISGAVTDVFGAPVWDAGVEVYAWDDGWSYAGGAGAGPDGTYLVGSLEPGRYVVYFWSWLPQYLPEWYDDAATPREARQIDVGFGEEVMGIDAVLSEGSTRSGAVNGVDGPPLDGVRVAAWHYDAYYDDWDEVVATWTEADGSYAFDHLQSGLYRLEFRGVGPYLGEWYGDALTRDDGANVEVPRDAAVTGIDAVLERGGSVGGQVSGDAGGIAGISVAAYQPDGHGGWRRVAGAKTDTTGATPSAD